jgi:hypothetical protein
MFLRKLCFFEIYRVRSWVRAEISKVTVHERIQHLYLSYLCIKFDRLYLMINNNYMILVITVKFFINYFYYCYITLNIITVIC